ncbi:MAG: acyltransferase domain-containing protein [Acidobacteriaceae bacterium]|nr:acyltransferase domain-containing protein [Acidobacteriaceae bacterium]
MTTSGKIQRHASRQQFLAGTLEVVGEWRESLAHEDDGQPDTRLPPPAAPTPSISSKPLAVASIREWLGARLSRQLKIPERDIDLLRPFASYGLDSVEAVGLSAEMEAWLGRRLSPTLAWEYPTIDQLSRFLAGEAVSSAQVSERPLRESVDAELVAIVGVGCRFPGAPNPEAFWRLLRNGEEAIIEVPGDRWDVNALYDPKPATPGKMNSRWGGFLPDIDEFDAAFFSISPREAARMDPQQRLLLEVAWEALEDGGLVPSTLAGTPTGVFIGISSSDYAHLLLQSPDTIDVYDGTGSALSIAANRLSYAFDWRGPSVAVDTACSSSLVAVHLACQSLLRGEATMALAGGVNLILAPEVTINLCQARMLAADGRCKPFAADADGYVRGEGCGVVVLKRLADALADGDRIQAVIRGTAMNQDGRSNGLTAPNGLAQQTVIRAALHRAHLAPADIGYIEAHGSGTPLGDPIEWQALEAVFQPNESDGTTSPPCAVGSVKTNIGHLEAAAGIAGLIKVVLALQHRRLPAHLHLQEINPRISLDGSPLRIPTTLSEWPARGARLRAGVSSFGFGGTNAHVIVQEPPTRPARVTEDERPLHLLTLSARTESALQARSQLLHDHLEQHPALSLPDVCLTENAGREHFHERFALVAHTREEAADLLDRFVAGRADHNGVRGQASRNARPTVAFLFSGQGTQYAGMGRELYRAHPAFRQTLEHCADLLRPLLDRPLLSLLFAEPGQDALLHQTAYTQPVLFALEYSLAQLWRSWGVEPDLVMGHSLGEYVAACVSGMLRLEDGLKLVIERGRLMQRLPEAGAMAAVFADESQVAPVLEAYRNHVTIAALNGPANTVLSGQTAALQQVLRELEGMGLRTQVLASASHAFHSPLMEPILDAFEEAARLVNFSAPQIPLVSNRTGEVLPPEEWPGASYWRHHTRDLVRFSEGIHTLAAHGVDIFLEVGPHSTLIEMGRRCLPHAPAQWLASLQRGQHDWQVLLQSLAECYAHGVSIDWDAFDRGYQRKKVSLPTYPFERRRYWVETTKTNEQPSASAPASRREGTSHPLLGRRLSPRS